MILTQSSGLLLYTSLLCLYTTSSHPIEDANIRGLLNEGKKSRSIQDEPVWRDLGAEVEVVEEEEEEEDKVADVEGEWCAWIRLEWNDLGQTKQLAAAALGFRPEQWNNGLENGDEPYTWPVPRTDCDFGTCPDYPQWDSLNDDEQEAAGVFGFNEKRWDNAEHYVDCRHARDPYPCLSGYSQLYVLGKGDTFVRNIAVGDEVLVANSMDHDIYQEVFSFGHKDVYAETNFLQIKTSGEHEMPLEITGEHLLMKRNLDGSLMAVRADSISVGDHLVGNKGVSELVTQISTVMRNGLYSPLTRDGTIVANGLQVSSYTATQNRNAENYVVGNLEVISHHLMSHAAIGPLRSMCLVMGGYSTLCQQRNEEGQLLYVAGGEKLISWIEEQALEIQIVVLSFLMVGIMSFHAVEKLFCCFILSSIPLIMLLIHGLVKKKSEK